MKRKLIIAILGFCITMFLIGSVALFKEHAKQMQKYTLLMEQGVKAEALVLSKERIKSSKYSGNVSRGRYQFFYYYQATYSYLHESAPSDSKISLADYLPNAPEKAESASLGKLTATSMAPKEVFNDISAGSKIHITYVYNQPKTATILNKDGSLTKPSVIYLAGIAMFLLFGSIFILYYYLKTGKVL